MPRLTSSIINNHVSADPEPWLLKAVTDHFWDQYLEAGKDTKAFAVPGTRWRASWSGMCARAIAYEVAGIPESDPMTVADAWTFEIGTLVHEMVQEVVENRFPGSVSEYKVTIGKNGSGHIDIHIKTAEGKKITVEMKTINGTGFRMMPREGARYRGIIQGAVNAFSMPPEEQPDEMILLVFSLEKVNSGKAREFRLHPDFEEYARVGAQYTFSKEEYTILAEEEILRMERIVQLVDDGELTLVPRLIPDPSLPRHEVINPRNGEIRVRNEQGWAKGTRKVWHCNYCSHQSYCAEQYKIETEAAAMALLQESIPGAVEVDE